MQSRSLSFPTTRLVVFLLGVAVTQTGCGDGDEGSGGGGGAGHAGAGSGGSPEGGGGSSGTVGGGAGGDEAGQGGEATGGHSGTGGSDKGGTGGTAGESGAGEGGGAVGGAGTAGVGGAGMGGGGSGGTGGACSGATCCVKVSPNGDDDLAAQSQGQTPFRNVEPAIDFADTHRSVATRVCVAGGATCEDAAYPGPDGADLRMKNGISVFGGYESTSFTRCDPLAEIELHPGTPLGVVFDADVQSETTLDGFTIVPFAAPSTAGVTVRGSSGVRLSRLSILDDDVADWYGLDLVGAEARVSNLHLEVGRVSRDEAIGVRSLDSRLSLDGSIRVMAATGVAYAVSLEDSPDSLVTGDLYVSNSDATGAAGAVKVTGDAEGVAITDSAITVNAGLGDAFGIWLEDCAGGAPLIADNSSIAVSGRSTTSPIEGIRSIGACHPRIESNDSISAIGSNAVTTTGIRCAALAGTPSRCVILDNGSIWTDNPRAMPSTNSVGVGIRCEGGSCAEIRGNTITGLTLPNAGCQRSCQYDAYGVILESTDARVHRNVIRAGCADQAAGIRASGAAQAGPARIENNVVFGRSPDGVCGQIQDGVTSSAAIVSLGASIDVHSNTLDGGGTALPVSACSSAAVAGGSGSYRNNILLSGICPASGAGGATPAPGHYGFAESTFNFAGTPPPFGSPSVLAHNDLAPGATAPYLAGASSPITSIDVINGMFGPGNFSADPGFASGFHLGSGSACVNAGTTEAAPLFDFDGQARDSMPDVGADEL